MSLPDWANRSTGRPVGATAAGCVRARRSVTCVRVSWVCSFPSLFSSLNGFFILFMMISFSLMICISGIFFSSLRNSEKTSIHQKLGVNRLLSHAFHRLLIMCCFIYEAVWLLIFDIFY